MNNFGYTNCSTQGHTTEELIQMYKEFDRINKKISSDMFIGPNMNRKLQDIAIHENPMQTFFLDTLFGMRIHVEEDYEKRIAKAIWIHFDEHRPVIIENDKGELVEFSLPECDSELFSPDFAPAQFIADPRRTKIPES